MFNLNETVAQKVLDVVRHGLTSGLGVPKPGKMCVEAAVCYALGLPHSDDPKCVDQCLRNFKVILNDSMWSSSQVRAKGLERLAIAQLGTFDTLDTKAFIDGLMVLAKKWADQAQEMANIAVNAAFNAAAVNAAAFNAANDAADYAADAANSAHKAYHSAANDADVAAAKNIYPNVYNISAAMRFAYVAKYAADVAADAAARDKVLSQCAEDVVQLLIKLEAPGTKYLFLTELN